MSRKKLKAFELVSKARMRAMSDKEWQWISGIMMMGTVTYVDEGHKVTTACTNGVDEIYNKAWLEQFSFPEAMYIVLHENMHKMLRHTFTTKHLYKENPYLANIAVDVVVNNQWLNNKPFIEMPKGPDGKVIGVDMPEYADASVWDTEKIFRDLQKKSKKEKNAPDYSGSQGFDEHDYDSIEEMSAEEQKQISRQVDMALRQAAMAGSLNGGMPRSVREMLVPEVDWRAELAEFVKSTCVGQDKQTWRKPHRTYIAHDLYMPSPYSENIGRVLIAGDTSGSIGEEALSLFLGHMQHLVNEVNPNGVDIAWWDTKVAGVDRFEQHSMTNLAGSVRPAGGGGTDPSCITPWRKKEKQEYVCAVVITDGEFSDNIGDWSDLPVLWLVVGKNNVSHIRQGKVIQVSEIR